MISRQALFQFVRGGKDTSKGRLSGLKTESGFRLIRGFTVEHNAARFTKHCARLVHALHQRRDSKKMGLRLRRIKQAKKGGPQ